MFAKEFEMTSSVSRWMKAGGMTTKSQFVTPSGICDLVALRFNPRNVARRVDLKQTRSIASITRAVILLQIPDVETRRSIALERLIRHSAPFIPEELVRKETARLIADRFVLRSSRNRLQKVNGWVPLQHRFVAVELKLARISEAMGQAVNNLGFADESYVALPVDVARRVAADSSRWSKFFDAGIGLLSVAPRRCEVLRPANKSENLLDKAVQFYCVEKFWNSRVRGS
jgi:hypothetical protein